MLEKIKNISVKTIFEIITILIYTYFNLYIIKTIINMDYWWLYIIQNKEGVIFLSIIMGLFLNAGLILYYLRKK
ncbi:MAG: hypothetical protein U9O55_02605 [Patescibacteria group bacterium]|nr:hypothetical protein [Patescibacteria group bacterium]